MKMMEKNNSFLDKVINVLYWENNSDMYIKRYTELFRSPQRKVLGGHDEKEITGQHIIIESVTSGDSTPPTILAPLAK